VAIGTALSTGRYELAERVGSGGMGEVYRARDRALDRIVAVKVPSLEASDAARERFRREARAAARLDHPNIVRVYDWDEQDGAAYIVMEFVDGRSLHQILVERGRLDPREAAEIGVQIADALEHAHQRGVVHRDVKPANVLVTADGLVKVTDFGIARAGDETLTEPGAVLGTAGYVSPEQLRGDEVDGRSDVYSLGMLLARLTGDAPGALAPVIARATSVDPAARYASARDMRVALVPVAADAAPAATPSPTPVSPVPPPRPAPPTRPAQAAPPVKPTLPLVAPPAELPKLTKPVRPVKPMKARRARVWRVRHIVMIVLPVLLVAACVVLVIHLLTPTPQVTVPEVESTGVFTAAAALQHAHLHADIHFVDNPSPGGTVLGQDPASGKRVDKGGSVVLTVSRVQAVVPDVSGFDLDTARTKLAAVGFGTVNVTYQDRDDEIPGTVLGSTPTAGVRADKSAALMLLVAQNPYVTVPKQIVGEDQATADAVLRFVGLESRVVTQSSSTVSAGTVISSNPSPGQSIRRGTVVTLNVSSGPRQVTVPPVINESRGSAIGALQDKGFLVAVKIAPVTSGSQDGKVIAQSPNGGTAAVGSTVTITVGQRTGH
jgi:serine/threonine-protein kinase